MSHFRPVVDGYYGRGNIGDDVLALEAVGLTQEPRPALPGGVRPPVEGLLAAPAPGLAPKAAAPARKRAAAEEMRVRFLDFARTALGGPGGVLPAPPRPR